MIINGWRNTYFQLSAFYEILEELNTCQILNWSLISNTDHLKNMNFGERSKYEDIRFLQ